MWWKQTNKKEPGAGKTYEEKFWERTAKKSDTECWEWIGGKTPEGYGCLKAIEKNRPAHRISYEIHIGEIPKNKIICHHCDNPSCVNPKHLFVGTHQDNQADKVTKGRQAKGKTHGFFVKPQSVSQGENHHKTKLTKKDVIDIRNKFASNGITRQQLAKQYNVNWSTIDRLLKGKSWEGIKYKIPHNLLNKPRTRDELGRWK